ncbi:MAG: ACT domain-containing protein [Negativicutes bacterium]
MIIQQISVFVENRPGTLAEVLGVLQEHDINLRAMSVADTADFGILRMVVNDPEKVERILRGSGYAVKSTPVLTLTVADTPGGLLRQVEKMSTAGINVEYLYAFAATSADEARVVIKVDNLERAERIVNGEALATNTGKEKGDVPGFYW